MWLLGRFGQDIEHTTITCLCNHPVSSQLEMSLLARLQPTINLLEVVFPKNWMTLVIVIGAGLITVTSHQIRV